jgi:Prokaryotic E2 family E
VCPRAAQDEVTRLSRRGIKIELVDAVGQCYALASGVDAPVSPWDRASYDILIAIPAAYDDAGLDAFYLGLPYTFKGGTHPRVQGAVIELNGRRWQLVSWHYPEGASWKRGQENLETHTLHCKGFFLQRGAVNAY